MIVTPSRIQCSTIRSRIARRTAASWTRSLTPSVSRWSAAVTLATTSPSATSRPITSVRYSSPCALSVVIRAKRGAQRGDVERVDAGADLVELPGRLVGVALLDDRDDVAVGVCGPPGRSRWRPATSAVSTVAAALVSRVPLHELLQACRRSAAVRHPAARRTVPSVTSASESSASRTACPVPCCSSWTTVVAVRLDLVEVLATCWPRPWPTTTTVCAGAERLGRGEDVAEQAAAADRVQHLGKLGLHPLALTRREHDDGGRRGVGHPGSRHRRTAGRSTPETTEDVAGRRFAPPAWIRTQDCKPPKASGSANNPTADPAHPVCITDDGREAGTTVTGIHPTRPGCNHGCGEDTT